MNWRVDRSDVARIPWGEIVRSPIMVDVLDAELGEIIGVKVPGIHVKCDLVMSRGLMNFVRLLSGANRQLTVA